MIFSECVLVYLEGKYTDKLIEVMANNFKILFLLDYEMFNPNDNFGKMMVKNFEVPICIIKNLLIYFKSQKNAHY